MGRVLKRVPLDFDYPLGREWEGYCPPIDVFQELFGEKYPFLYDYKNNGQICSKCEANAGDCSEGADYCFWHNSDNRKKWFKEVPSGAGYQLWETTTNGSPVSPVFTTLNELCEWCEDNATIFGDEKATREKWKELLVGQ